MGDVSALALRLLGVAEVNARLGLLDAREARPRRASALLSASQGWPAVREVLERAIAGRRPVLVYGDYDVDGSFAAFMLFRYLRSRQVPGNIFLPSRFKHGYGLDLTVIQQAVAQGYQTLLALDCGTANAAEISAAVAGGMDAAIIDHHSPKAVLPQAALLNPHLDAALPPLCTAGLVYEILLALSAADSQALEGDELELAGLATVADIVPLEPHNWLLAHEALECLPQTANPGLAELIKISRLHGLDRLTSQQAAFQLVPRLNAAGRMRTARLVLELLGAPDGPSARQAALELDRLNELRKQEADAVFRKAVLQGAEFSQEQALALYAPDWHAGVLGIVAARVAEQLGKPAIILCDAPGQPELLTGSARTAGGINLIEALHNTGTTAYSFGGHAQAAGVKLERQRLAQFRELWSAAVAGASNRVPDAPVQVYPDVALHELTAQFEHDMWRLAPFGPAYPAPRCILRHVRVARVNYMGRDKTHLSLVVSDGVREVRIAAFNQSHLFNRLREGTLLSPVIEIDADNWNNANTITLRLLAVD